MSDEPEVYETGFIEYIEILDDAEDVKPFASRDTEALPTLR